jgi:hypothetical protein
VKGALDEAIELRLNAELRVLHLNRELGELTERIERMRRNELTFRDELAKPL